MPGLGDIIGGIFGGGGSDPFNLDLSGIADAGTITPDVSDFLGSTQPFDFSNLFSTLNGAGSTIGDIGGNLPSLFAGGSGPGTLNLGGVLSGGSGGTGGFTLPNGAASTLLKTVSGASGGGSTPAGVPGGTTSITSPAPTAANAPGALGSLLPGLLNNPALLSTIPAIFQAITAGDQTDLGPDAAAMRALATGNQSTIDSLQQEAQAEKTGMLPGQAMQSISDSLAQQKSALQGSYSRMGMSGSSAEAADLAALNRQSEDQRFQIGLNMANEGLSQVSALTGQDVSIYGDLMNAQAQRDTEYMSAMADLAGALGKAFGGSTGTTVNVNNGTTAAGTGVPQGGTTTNPGTNSPIDLNTLLSTPTPIPMTTVAPGVDPSTLVTPPDTTGLVNTPDQLAAIAQSLGLG